MRLKAKDVIIFVFCSPCRVVFSESSEFINLRKFTLRGQQRSMPTQKSTSSIYHTILKDHSNLNGSQLLILRSKLSISQFTQPNARHVCPYLGSISHGDSKFGHEIHQLLTFLTLFVSNFNLLSAHSDMHFDPEILHRRYHLQVQVILQA